MSNVSLALEDQEIWAYYRSESLDIGMPGKTPADAVGALRDRLREFRASLDKALDEVEPEYAKQLHGHDDRARLPS